MTMRRCLIMGVVFVNITLFLIFSASYLLEPFGDTNMRLPVVQSVKIRGSHRRAHDASAPIPTDTVTTTAPPAVPPVTPVAARVARVASMQPPPPLVSRPAAAPVTPAPVTPAPAAPPAVSTPPPTVPIDRTVAVPTGVISDMPVVARGVPVNDHNVCVSRASHLTSIIPGKVCAAVQCGTENPVPLLGSIDRGGMSRGRSLKPPSSHDCYVSEKYKFVYVHVLKSGGSAVKSFLIKGICFGSLHLDSDPRCVRTLLRGDTCSSVFSKFPNFYYWTLVRNPFSREVSAWAMASAHLRNQRNPLPFSDYVFGKRAASAIDPAHYKPQSYFVVDNLGCPNLDYIGTLETQTEDMPRILERIGHQELSELYAKFGFMPDNGMYDPNNNFGTAAVVETGKKTKADFFDASAPASAVSREYASDFRVFGYSIDMYMGKSMR